LWSSSRSGTPGLFKSWSTPPPATLTEGKQCWLFLEEQLELGYCRISQDIPMGGAVPAFCRMLDPFSILVGSRLQLNCAAAAGPEENPQFQTISELPQQRV
uniref:Uncharacterized protein n=1 Tax=Malurus cyaneus samueli TaxID=2593467 RepID=A0A8C5U4Q9_9PASS